MNGGLAPDLPAAGSERQRNRRFPVALQAELWIGGRTYPGRIRNVSAGGAYFEFVAGLPPALACADAWLRTPHLGGSTPVELRHAHVEDGAPAGTGLRFRDPSIGLRTRIRGLAGGR